jgi:hypothetical protein
LLAMPGDGRLPRLPGIRTRVGCGGRTGMHSPRRVAAGHAVTSARACTGPRSRGSA